MFSVLHNQSAHTPAAAPSSSGALLPAWKMSQAQFESQAVCAAVDAVMVRAHLQLQPAEEADRNAVDRLRALAAGNAPASVGDTQAWAAAGVQRLLASVFQDDVLVAELPGIAHVVLVKRVQMPDGMELAEVLRRVHMRQVEEALAAGAPVPPAVREEYRDSMERLHVLQELAPREQLQLKGAAMNPMIVPSQRALDHRHVLAVRQAVERAMTRNFDTRRDREVVSRVSRELQAPEDVVAGQLAGLRLQAANDVMSRMRERAAAQGLTAAAAARLTTFPAMQAAALAARDGLLRAQQLQRERLGAKRALSELYAQEQERALMQRFEQSDEELEQDFEEAVREIAAVSLEDHRDDHPEDEPARPRMAA